MKKINFVAVITVILSCSFFGCEYFNIPMKEIIMDNSTVVKGIGYKVETPHHERSIAEVVIPPYEPDKPYDLGEPDKPDEPAKITISLYNPRNFDLQLELTGDINSQTASAEVELAEDKQTAIVTITNSSRFDTFDLTLNMKKSDDGRPMTPYKLPKIECRYINNYLRTLSVDGSTLISGHTPELTYPTDGSLIPAFNSSTVDYEVRFPEGTENVTISHSLYSGVFSSYSIKANDVDVTSNSNNVALETNTFNLHPGVNTMLITVTADSGIAKTYTILVKVRSGILNITFDVIIDGAPYIEGPTIYRSYDDPSNDRTKAMLTVDNPSQYTSIDWYIYLPGDLGNIHGTGSSFTLDSKNTAYNSIGEHYLTLEVVKGGITYNRTIIFTVVNY